MAKNTPDLEFMSDAATSLEDLARGVAERVQHSDLIAEIERLLDLHNGRRRMRLLVIDDVMHAVQSVGRGYLYCPVYGGTVPNAYKWPTTTTIAFCGRHSDGRVGLGVRTCDANKASPGRAWESLCYLGNCGSTKARARIDKWVERDADVVLGADGGWWPEAPATIVERGITA